MLLLLAVAIAVLSPAFSMVGNAGDDVRSLQEQTRRWLDIRKEIEFAKGQWKEQRALLLDEASLLETRKNQLESRVRDTTNEAAATKLELDDAEAGRDTVANALRVLNAPLEEAEEHLKRWRGKLPPFLVAELEGPLADIEAAGESQGEQELAARIRLVLMIYAQLQQFANTVHVGKALLTDPAGQAVEMDAFYLGIFRAFAVSPDRKRGATGILATDGWRWRWDPAVAAPTAQAIAIYRKESAARFVSLPLTIEQEGQ